MKQLTSKLKDGSIQIIEVPVPSVNPGMVLVQNRYSLISSGTEGSTIKTAKKGYLGKAKERPEQVKQVLDTLKTQGPVQTYRAVMKKLDAYSPLGYSCAGEVIDVAPGIIELNVGDLVACGGLSACHAEVVNVPVNLCVKLKPDADLKQAAYNTLGAIALQVVRQADLRLGETCAVIGLGLLGQLTCLLLRASGVRVVGLDIDQAMVDMATKHCADLALKQGQAGIAELIGQFTTGLGCDAVIITAATSSLEPINFAGAIARKRGTIIVVGAVPTGFDREPHFYRKELQVRMSCSYGPGRYDPEYEEKGQDYPIGYVRWTENRNMQAFQDLIYTRKADVSFLTTHVFKFEDAPKAYDLILERSEPSVGILIEYDAGKVHKPAPGGISLGRVTESREPVSVSIGFIGAGSYAQNHLLPNIPKNRDVVLRGVMTASSASARSTGERFGFEFCTNNADDILTNDTINTVFIATHHDTHATYVRQALEAGKNVFVEKPLCLKPEELEEIRNLYEALPQEHDAKAPILMVGYNRRFSPFIAQVKKKVGRGPMAAIYRINAGVIPPDSWIQDQEFGGGRIIGEVCHFVDVLTYLSGSLPISLYTASMPGPHNLHDTLQVCLSYADGSVGTIAYLANGDKSLSKERLEVFAHGETAVVEDFKTLTFYSKGKKKKKTLLSQDKGQKNEINLFLESLSKGAGEIIPFEEIYSASLVTFKIIESIQRGESLKL
ncbi:MAG: bi-domain-containing oxidoreductase [Deltaproteobacteria bacterium]|nr:bi-domain-containing oxidoreductase [Deltaproteobacteria bacterium]